MSDPYDQTRRIDPTHPVGGRPVDETQVIRPGEEARPGAPRPGERDYDPEAEAERRWPQYLIAGLVGVLIGFAFAFVVIAMGTSGQETDPTEATAAQERITALETELADREATIAEMEARLAEAEAAAGDRAEDVEAQRRALDERAAAMDERARALDEREMALDRRENEIAEREAAAEQPADQPDQPDDPGEQPDDGPGLPEFDPEQAENIVERVLERLRELFGQ